MPGITSVVPVPGSTNLTRNLLLGVGLVVGGYGVYELAQYAKRVRMRGDLNKDQASTITASKGKVLKDLNGKLVTSVNLSTIATDLKDSLTFPADEERAIRVFKTTPIGYVKKLEQMYLDKYGKNLKQELADELTDVQFMKIKFWFE